MKTPNAAKAACETKRDEIARLAYLTWLTAGCPEGRSLDYWLAAERRVIAAEPELCAEAQPQNNGHPESKSSKLKGARKTPARPKLAHQI